MKKLGFALGVFAGLLFILTGVLTALKITPEIAAVGLEVSLGIWRILAGTAILIFTFLSVKKKEMSWGIIGFGVFEIFVYVVEQDYSILTISPFIAIISGFLMLKRL